MAAIIRSPQLHGAARGLRRGPAAVDTMPPTAPPPLPVPLVATRPEEASLRADLERRLALSAQKEAQYAEREEALAREAQRISSAARALEERCLNAERDAAERGYAAGAARGQAEAEAAAAAALATAQGQLAALALELGQQRQRIVMEAEDALVEVTLAALGKLLCACAATPASVRTMVDAALREFEIGDAARIHLSQQDADLLAGTDAEPPGVLVIDPALAAGGVCVHTARGSLEARLELQLAALCKTLVAARAQRELPP